MKTPELTVPVKIYLLTAVFSIGLIGYGLWSWSTLAMAKVHGPYYNEIVQNKDLIADILPPPNYIIESYLVALHMANEVDERVDAATMQNYVERCHQLQEEFDVRHDFWIADLPEGEMKRIKTVDCYEPAVRFYRVVNEQFIPACMAGDAATAQQLARGSLREHYETHRTAIDKVVSMATQRSADVEVEASTAVQRRAAWSTGLILLIVGGCGAFGVWTAHQIFARLNNSANALRTVATRDLQAVSSRMNGNASDTSSQATQAANAAEIVSANVQSLAAAVQQFDSSIREISGNTTNAASVARTAVDAASQTTQTVAKLGTSSNEISNVIQAINSIAEQTNLLALNATIEAARAGEAGKGFAVVANEVKELAKQTSTATEDIVGQIEMIQADTEHAVTAINDVSQIINEINESQNAIASAVEEQSAMTGEISRNIVEVSNGSDTIAKNIACVATAASSTKQSTDETLQASNEIEGLAEELLSLIGAAQSMSGDADSPRGKYQLSTADPTSLVTEA